MANKVSFIIQMKDKFSAASKGVEVSMRKLERNARRTNRALEKQKKAWKGLTEQAGRFAKKGAVMTAALTAPFALLSRHMINAASDATETANKFNSVFDDVEGKANQVADQFSRSFGVAGSTARKMIGDTGDLLVGFGFTGEAALKMSKQVNELASDLASFQNFSGGAEGASIALTKALLGESESAKALGIVVRQGTTEFKKNVRMIQRTQRVSLLQAKAIEIMRIAQSQSRKAIGDVNRTWEDYANVVRRNKEATKELSESFGQLMLPMATKLTSGLTRLVKWVNNLSPAMKKIVLVLGGLVAIGGPLLLILAGITTAFTVISLPVLAVSAAILALIAIGVLLAANWDSIVKGLKDLWQDFAGFIGDLFGSIGDIFSLLFQGRLIDAVKTWANVTIKIINTLLKPFDLLARLLGFDAGTVKIPEFNVNIDQALLKSVQEAPSINQKSLKPIEAPSSPSQPVSGTVNGQIVVSAAPGAQIKETTMESSGPGLNLGMNMAGR